MCETATNEEAADGEDPTYVQRQWDAAYSAGKQHGRDEAWAEAMQIVKSAAASEYISGGDTSTARTLRGLCLEVVHAAYQKQEPKP